MAEVMGTNLARTFSWQGRGNKEVLSKLDRAGVIKGEQMLVLCSRFSVFCLFTNISVLTKRQLAILFWYT